MNITLLILAIYVILFPIISLALEKINPTLTQCVYLKFTGKECPLCGGTRYIKNIGNALNDISYLFNFFGAVIIIIIFNIAFRITNILRIKCGKNMGKIINFDILFHSILLVIYIIYEIMFLIH